MNFIIVKANPQEFWRGDQFGVFQLSSLSVSSPHRYLIISRRKIDEDDRFIGGVVEYLVKACKGSRHNIGHFFYLDARSIEIRSFRCTRYFVASSIILSCSRTERKSRGSTVAWFVWSSEEWRLSRGGNATWFAGRRVTRVIARRDRATCDSRIYLRSLLFFFSYSLLYSFSCPLVEPNVSTIEDPFSEDPAIYTEAVARTRARLLVARRSPFVSAQFWKILNDN